MLAVGVAGLGLLLVRGIRTSRTGRVLLAQRDNERAAAVLRHQRDAGQALRLRRVGRPWPGWPAALYVASSGQYSEQPFEPAVSFNVFTASVVGGLGSLTGAVIGALFLNGGQLVPPGRLAAAPVGARACCSC